MSTEIIKARLDLAKAPSERTETQSHKEPSSAKPAASRQVEARVQD